ncbi:hypothetical protein XENORESO_013802 [Xenotaenia resolanae]|uniref:Uncharacterized protein n=1 Tax=Xenotaenia resolanae TaxID=208358 RepID=A0ABV0VX59_9TELE
MKNEQVITAQQLQYSKNQAIWYRFLAPPGGSFWYRANLGTQNFGISHQGARAARRVVLQCRHQSKGKRTLTPDKKYATQPEVARGCLGQSLLDKAVVINLAIGAQCSIHNK